MKHSLPPSTRVLPAALLGLVGFTSLAAACGGETRPQDSETGVLTTASASASATSGTTNAPASSGGPAGSDSAGVTTTGMSAGTASTLPGTDTTVEPGTGSTTAPGTGSDPSTGAGTSSTVDPSTDTTVDPSTSTTGQIDACEELEPIPASLLPLLDDVVGFAEDVTGGQGGCLYRVTNTNDAGPGSLRAGAESEQPLWIVFDIDGDITLNSEIRVKSNKTIDGRGAYIRIFDDGLHILDGEHNVVIHNLIFKEDQSGADSDDAIRLQNDAHTVWVDHVSFSNYPDGLLDVTRRATDVTVSWCKFSNHSKVMLIGASPDHDFDTVIRVTVHHTWFRETVQRHPRLRFGKVHTFNNYYDRWTSYGAASSMHGQLYSERNIYDAGASKDAVLSIAGSDPDAGDVNSVDDWELGGAVVDENNPNDVFKPNTYYSYTTDAANDALRDAIVAGAGWQDVPLP